MLEPAPASPPHATPPRPRLPTPWLTIAIGVALVGAFVAAAVAGAGVLDASPQALVNVGGNFAPLTLDGEPWRLGASMFLHGGLMHLVMNLIGLASGGVLVERLYGRLGMTLVYVLAGLAGGLASALAHPTTVAIGASGAIFGLFGASGAYFLAHRRQLDASIYRQQMKGLGVFVGINLLFGLSQPRIDMAAHAGGLAAGAVLGLLLEWGTPPAFAPDRAPRGRRQLAVAGVATFLLVLGVASAAPRGPSPLAYQDAIAELGKVETQIRPRLAELSRAYDAGELRREAFAQQVEREVIAPWRAARDAHARVAPPAHMKDLHQALLDYADAMLGLHQATVTATSGEPAAMTALEAAGRAFEDAELAFVTTSERLRGGAAGAEQRAIDRLQAAELAQCDAGDGQTCWNLGLAQRQGVRGRAPQPEAGAELIRKGCEHGAAGACVEYGLLLENGGPGVALDLARAATFYERGCDGGDPYGCFDHALLLEGRGAVPRDRPRALALYRRACDRDLADACTNLGIMLDDDAQPGDATALAAARAAFDRGCALGQRQACVAAARMEHVAPRAAGAPPSTGLATLTTLCTEREGFACAVLADIYDQALGVKRDRARAAEFTAQACKAGYLDACPPLPPPPP